MEIELGNLENLQQEHVLRALKEALVDPEKSLPEGLCTCNACMVDIMAVALNSLPPRYVADKYYKFPDSLEGEGKAQEVAKRAVAMAIRRVSRRPHHDRE